jgi:kynureninase
VLHAARAWPAIRRGAAVSHAPRNLYSPGVQLTDYRDRFPILAETVYLINHSLGAMPAAAEERLAEYAHTWKTRGIRAWAEGWWDMPLIVASESMRGEVR